MKIVQLKVQLPTNLICIAELGGNLLRDLEPKGVACTWHRGQAAAALEATERTAV
jgi:hypothetical protein